MPRETCKACGRPKPALAVAQEDDFCSTECARLHYGTAGTVRIRAAATPHPAPIRHVPWRRPSALLNGRKQ